MTINDSSALRRRLRVELRKARLAAVKTQRDAAEALDWSPSKIIRIENGSVAVTTTDLRALLEYYGVRDRRLVEELIVMARGSKKQPWTQYKDILTPETVQYLGYATSSSIFRQFQTILVPGLLQTEEYTRALMRDGYGRPEAAIDRYVEFRQEFHESLLDRPEPPEMFFILDEGAIRRAVGGHAVMQHQLEHLSELAKRPQVTIQIVPFSLGAHFGMRGPYTYLEFPSADDDDVLYLENANGESVFRDEPETTGRYLQAFWDLERVSSPPTDLDSFLNRAIERLPPVAPEQPIALVE
jgi:transcriptional regulator with XRE-family HTH domain